MVIDLGNGLTCNPSHELLNDMVRFGYGKNVEEVIEYIKREFKR